jgi:Tfp pilus assembly protein PilX
MHLIPPRHSARHGNTLVIVMLLGGAMSLVVASTYFLTLASLRNAQGRTDWNAAFYHAENALQWAAQGLADATPSAPSNYFATANGTLGLAYMTGATSPGFSNAWVAVARTNAALPNLFLVVASARVNDKVRTLQAVVTVSPASQIFDYGYFLNNWGWWWGGTIIGNGANRANWDFDFRHSPVVNGAILASGNITTHGNVVNLFSNAPPFGGTAGADPLDLAHASVPRLNLPNLNNDFGYYSNLAMVNINTNGIWAGSQQVVYGVQTNASQPGLYLVATNNQTITISNIVVVPGDVVIQGKISGQGTLYVGGNLYIAGNLTYASGPDFSTPPETMAPAQRDQWVSDNKSKDLVAFAVKGLVLGGDVTSSDWVKWCFDPYNYGLEWRGDETHLGADGIPYTADDYIPYLNSNGVWTTAFDADGNGIIRGYYNYDTELTMTAARAAAIAGYPVDSNAVPLPYSNVASNHMSLVEGIFYTDHAYAMRMTAGSSAFHGVVISRDEAIVVNGGITFDYDSRVNSRYHNDPNRFINLGLPVAGLLSITQFTELPPDPTNL